MSYKVAISQTVKQRVAEYDLPDAIRERFYQAVRDEFREDYVPWIRRIVAPVRCCTYKIRLFDLEGGVTHEFFLWVNETQRHGWRVILEVEHSVSNEFEGVTSDD